MEKPEDKMTEFDQLKYMYRKYSIPQAWQTGFAYGLVIGLLVGSLAMYIIIELIF